MKNFDIFDLGDFIENAVDKAISSQNFSELNKNISQAIDRSADLLNGAKRGGYDPSVHLWTAAADAM